MPPRTDFIQQVTVGKKYKVTLPNKVADRLIPGQSDDELQADWDLNKEPNDELEAQWNLNREHNDVVISTVELSENYTTVRKFGKIYDDNGVTVAKKVRRLLDISQGDDVYFIGMSDDEYPIPAVLFWTFERMEEMIMEGNKQTSYDYLRVPEFV